MRAEFRGGGMGELAIWFTHNDEEAFCLQIELGNDRAITVTFEGDRQPHVTLWEGSGEKEFESQTPESFAGWLANARTRAEE